LNIYSRGIIIENSGHEIDQSDLNVYPVV